MDTQTGWQAQDPMEAIEILRARWYNVWERPIQKIPEEYSRAQIRLPRMHVGKCVEYRQYPWDDSGWVETDGGNDLFDSGKYTSCGGMDGWR